jgi:hypothetical protein
MNNPTVNIFITFSREKMNEFIKTGSLFEFTRRTGKFGTQQSDEYMLFTNNPNSSLLELQHSYGLDKGDKGSYLTLKFVDATGEFENFLSINPGQSFSTNNDPISQILADKKSELEGLENDYDDLNTWWNSTQENIELAAIDDQIEQLEAEIEGFDDLNNTGGGSTGDIEIVRKQIALYNSMQQRPMYITYGVGSNVEQWCPPMVFDQVTKAEYKMGADQARIITLTYDGVGVHPNLGVMGIDPLERFSLGSIIQGSSPRLFNEKTADEITKRYPDALQSQFYPSLHYLITETMKSFIKQATGTNNVVVLFPDLDVYLGRWRKACEDEAEAKRKIWGDWFDGLSPSELSEKALYWMDGTKNALQGLGFSISDTNQGKKRPMSDALLQEVEEQVEAGGDPDKIVAWLQNRIIKIHIKTDGLLETFQEKLKGIGKQLSDKCDQYSVTKKNGQGEDEKLPTINPSLRVEVDYRLVQLLYNNNYIQDPNMPVIIYGDSNVIDEILYGMLAEKEADPQALTKLITRRLSTFDTQNLVTTTGSGPTGYGVNFVKEAYKNTIGPPVWLSHFSGEDNPFSNALDGVLPDDSNVSDPVLEAIGDEDKASPLRSMPIFTFGTKSPNILGINLDIDNQFSKLMNSFSFVNLNQAKVTSAVLQQGDAQTKDLMRDLNSMIGPLAAGPGGLAAAAAEPIPFRFKALIKPYFKEDIMGTDGEASIADDLGAIFNSIGVSEFTDIDGTRFVDGIEQFYEFMWKAVLALFTKQGGSMNIPQQGASWTSMISQQASITDSLSKETLVATIKTLPYFNLASRIRVINRPSIILGIEPIMKQSDTNKPEQPISWFSGVYQLTGFKHTITSTTAHSEFAVTRQASTGGVISLA